MASSTTQSSPGPDGEMPSAGDKERVVTIGPGGKGYAPSRFNATKHGILSKETVLAWEDPAAYDELHASLIEEHHPKGPTEAHLVEELAGIIWRKRRLRQAENGAVRHGLRESIGDLTTSPTLALRHVATVGAALAEVAHDRVMAGRMPLAAEAVQQTEEVALAALENVSLALKGIQEALTILATKGSSKYQRALAALEPETCALWRDELERCEIEGARPPIKVRSLLSDPEDQVGVFYEPTAGLLALWLEREAIPHYETRRVALKWREAIRQQAYADAIDPDRLEKLARYETHLDRKLEKMLAMLIKLQEIRRAREAS